MRIIYWVGTLGSKFGGLERYFVVLARICKEKGHEIVFIHESPNIDIEYNDNLKEAGAVIVVIPNSYKDTLNSLLKCMKFLKIWKPNIVHIHFVNPLALPILNLFSVPLIYQTYHSGIDHKIALRTRMIRVMVNNCTKRNFAVSNRVRIDEIKAGIHPNHIQTLPLGLPIQDFLSSANRHIGSIPPGYNDPSKKIIITVGRFYPEKGMRYSVEAAVEVVKQQPDVIWWLVGKDGPEKEYALSLVQQAGLSERILFLGQRNDVPFLMKRADLQVVGSLYEGLGLMALESSAVGIPTVGTRIGGLDEAILDGVTGILVPRFSGSALAEAAFNLINDDSLRNKMGLAARNHVENNYDAGKLINDLLNIYECDFLNIQRDN